MESNSEDAVLLKVENTGSSTKTGVDVSGVKVGAQAVSTNVSGARGVVGQVTGSSPTNTSSTVGVAGSGYYGVFGSGTIGVAGGGNSVGVQGFGGYGIGVQGIATVLGVSGEADYSGIEGTANYGTGVSGYGYDYGIYGEGGSYGGYFEGDVYVDGVVYDGSDQALKENIRPSEKGLSAILSLKPKAYEMKPGVTPVKLTGTRLGLIAQDVETVVPEVVKRVKAPIQKNPTTKLPDPAMPRSEYLSVNYTGLVPVLIKAIQEQQAQIEALQVEVAALRK